MRSLKHHPDRAGASSTSAFQVRRGGGEARGEEGNYEHEGRQSLRASLLMSFPFPLSLQRIAEAFNILSDTDKRAAFDQGLDVKAKRKGGDDDDEEEVWR